MINLRRGIGDVCLDANSDPYTCGAADQLAGGGVVTQPNSTFMTGAPLPLGSSTVASTVNQIGPTLSSNSTLIVAVCAIIGVFIAMSKR